MTILRAIDIQKVSVFGLRLARLQNDWVNLRVFGEDQHEKQGGHFGELSKSSYQEQFAALAAYLLQIASEMGSIRLVKWDGSLAEFDLRTTRNGVAYSFLLLFVKYGNGVDNGVKSLFLTHFGIIDVQ